MSEVKVNKISPRSGTAFTLGDSGDTFTVPSGAGLTLTDSTLLLPTTITSTTEVKTNKISPATGVAFALGDSGDTFTVPSGATIVNSGTATGFGGGLLLQSISAVIAAANGTTVIAWDDTTPLVSEGTEIFSQDLTPANSSNKVRIHGVIQCGSASLDTSNGFAFTMYRDSTLVGVYGYMDFKANTDTSFALPIDIIDAPSSTSAIDYSIRIGMLYRASHNTSDWYVGGSNQARFNGAYALNTIELNEIDGT